METNGQKQNKTVSTETMSKSQLASLATLLIALEGSHRLTKMSSLVKLSETFQYLTSESAEESLQHVLHAAAQPQDSEHLKQAKSNIFAKKLSSLRTRQIITRLFRIARKSSSGPSWRSKLFNEFFCAGSSKHQSKGLRGATAVFCGITNGPSHSGVQQKSNPRIGPYLFGGSAVKGSVSLA